MKYFLSIGSNIEATKNIDFAIYELGLIYDVFVNEDNDVKILMTLTTPNCPVAETLPKEVKDGAMQVDGIEEVDLELVWDPPWTKDMMSEAAKLELNL